MHTSRWFAYMTGNRRYEKPVVELVIDFEAQELAALERDPAKRLESVVSVLVEGGVLEAGEPFPDRPLPGGTLEYFGSILAQLAILIQRKCGHRVSWYSVTAGPGPLRCLCLVEHEHGDVGMTATKLALEVLFGSRRQLAQPFLQVREFAEQRTLPVDTEAVIEAAQGFGIPCRKMDRNPYGRDPKNPEIQEGALRRNGLLALGQGPHQLLVEGTVCEQRSPKAMALLAAPGKAQALCDRLGIPMKAHGAASEYTKRLTVMLAGNELMGAVTDDGREAGIEELKDLLHPSYFDSCEQVAAALDAGVLAIDISAQDGAQPIFRSGYIRGIDPAPNLAAVLPSTSPLLKTLTRAFVRRLFPEGGASRIPIVSVTGSNGKTTTSRMIAHIMKHTNPHVGLACTEGLYIDGARVFEGDCGAVAGHYRLFSREDVELAVLETHHKSLFKRGLAFDWCNVAVCTNVTDEHIGPGGVESVEEMAQVKGSLLESARDGVVLNADNPGCLTMLPRMSARTTMLASTTVSAGELRHRYGSGIDAVVVEEIEGDDWCALHVGDRRIPLIRVADIPATFGGRAGFNVSNALHAAAASFLMGADAHVIRAGLEGFEAGSSLTPGRLNFHDNGRFTVLVDYAHNAAGLQELAAFTDQLEVKGRKIILFAIPGDRRDEAVRAGARAVAGHFDHYICRRYPTARGRADREVPELLGAALRESGVDPARITVAYDPEAAVKDALALGRHHDLMVLTHSGEELKNMWPLVLASG